MRIFTVGTSIFCGTSIARLVSTAVFTRSKSNGLIVYHGTIPCLYVIGKLSLATSWIQVFIR